MQNKMSGFLESELRPSFKPVQLLKREVAGKSSTGSLCGLHGNKSFMVLHDLFTNGQTDTRTLIILFRVEALEYLEHFFGITGVETKTIIGDTEGKEFGIFLDTWIRDRFPCEYIGVDLNQRMVAGRLKFNSITYQVP